MSTSSDSSSSNNSLTPAASSAAQPKKQIAPEKIAERVYQLMLEDARRERERRG